MAIHPTGHSHDVDLETALGFLNTLKLESGRLEDHLRKPAHAAEWFDDHALLHHTAARHWTMGDLDVARRVRAALREVVHAVVEGRRPSMASIEVANKTLKAHRPPRLELDGATIRVGHRHMASPVSDALAGIAKAIVGELVTGRADRFRVCANDRCRSVFFDESAPGRRRWCDMKSCGNRAKAARHRERLKAKGQTAQAMSTREPFDSAIVKGVG